jgi:hypothetical protein
MPAGCGDPDRDHGTLLMSLEAETIRQCNQRSNVEQDVMCIGSESLDRHGRPASALDQGGGIKGRQIETDYRRDNSDTIWTSAQNVKDILAASMMMKTAYKLLSNGGCSLSAAMLADAVEHLDVSIMHHTASGRI